MLRAPVQGPRPDWVAALGGAKYRRRPSVATPVTAPVRGRHYDQLVPIYEFDCSACGARFERLVAAGTERAACPECGAEDATRLLSSFAAPVRQMTANQRRRAEDKRGTDRDGARSRFKRSLARARGKDESAKRRPGRAE